MNKPLSREYLLKQGHCCNNNCTNCPYKKNNMKDWNEITPLRIILVILGITLLIALLPSCTVYELTPTKTQHNCELMQRGQSCLSDHRCCETQEHPTEVYYYNELPYWGLYSGYYYYYGIPHYYPWWYYYSLRPHYSYNVNTHVYIHCDNGHYVSTPRGPKFNNGTNRTYKPNKTITVKPNRGNNRTIIKTNTQRTNTKVIVTPIKNTKVKTNINSTRPNNNTKVKTNRSNTIKVKTNRTNTNRSNNKRTNTRKPR